MADQNRYVRVKQLSSGRIFYGVLNDGEEVECLSAAPWSSGSATGVAIKKSDYELLVPCEPSKIIAVGKNYVDHAAEFNSEVPKEPLLFLKPPSSLLASGGVIKLPGMSRRVDYEGELALVVGAAGEIWGYTIANDVSARDLQKRDGQWTRAKGFDTFCPVGPWIVQKIPSDAQIETFLNDNPVAVQSVLVSKMVFGCSALLEAISQVMTLIPGDIILTGTPAGVGPLKDGDAVRVVIKGIGELRNTVRKS